MDKKKEEKLITRDWLAIERTKLANERTFLAYFRTSVVFLVSGITIFKLELFSEVRILGAFMTMLAPLVLLVGVIRLQKVKETIKKYYDQ